MDSSLHQPGQLITFLTVGVHCESLPGTARFKVRISGVAAMGPLCPKMVMYLLDLCPQLASFPAGIFTKHQLPGPWGVASFPGELPCSQRCDGVHLLWGT